MRASFLVRWGRSCSTLLKAKHQPEAQLPTVVSGPEQPRALERFHLKTPATVLQIKPTVPGLVPLYLGPHPPTHSNLSTTFMALLGLALLHLWLSLDLRTGQEAPSQHILHPL